MRLFIGLDLDASVREVLANFSGSLQTKIPASYVPSALFHITLAYLGERDKDRLALLQELLKKVADDTAVFPLMLSSLGWFGETSNAILYAGLKPSAALVSLNVALRENLAHTGETFDSKPLVPHITLARKAVLKDEDSTVLLPPVMFHSKALSLFHSVHLDGELQYLPIYVAPFSLE